MHIHPVFSAFPFALLVVALLAEIASLTLRASFLGVVARVNLIAAALGVVAAFLSGYQAAELANQTFAISDDVIAAHHQWGRLLLLTVLPCVVLKIFAERAHMHRNVFRVCYYIFLLTSVALCVVTGYQGGELVFRHGAGVGVR